jgi:hypothetical protein
VNSRSHCKCIIWAEAACLLVGRGHTSLAWQRPHFRCLVPETALPLLGSGDRNSISDRLAEARARSQAVPGAYGDDILSRFSSRIGFLWLTDIPDPPCAHMQSWQCSGLDFRDENAKRR